MYISKVTGDSIRDPIRHIVETAPEMSGHYSMRKLFAACDDSIVLSFIVGARRIGKTLFLQYVMCRLFEEFGLSTLWVRNKKIEFDSADFRGGFLNAAKRLGWCPETWICDPEGVKTCKGGDLVCHFEGVSTFSNKRGNESAGTLMIVLDEMMPEDRRYPPRAHTGLMSLTKTVLSGKVGSRCFCLSNFVASGNPYFSGFRIFPDRKRDVTVFPDKGMAIEVCRGYRCAIDEGSPWTRVYQAGRYSDYSDADEDLLFQLIERTPRGSTPVDIVLRIGKSHYRPWQKNGLYYFERCSDTVKGVRIYTDRLEDSGTEADMIPRWLRSQLTDLAVSNLMRFKDVNVMYDVLSVIYSEV